MCDSTNEWNTHVYGKRTNFAAASFHTANVEAVETDANEGES